MVVASRVGDVKFNRDAREKSFNVLLCKPGACLEYESVLPRMQRA